MYCAVHFIVHFYQRVSIGFLYRCSHTFSCRLIHFSTGNTFVYWPVLLQWRGGGRLAHSTHARTHIREHMRRSKFGGEDFSFTLWQEDRERLVSLCRESAVGCSVGGRESALLVVTAASLRCDHLVHRSVSHLDCDAICHPRRTFCPAVREKSKPTK